MVQITDSVCPKGWRLLNYGERNMINYRFRSEDQNLMTAPFYLRSTWLTRSYYEDIMLVFYSDGYNYSYGESSLGPVRCVARYGMKE